MKKKVLSFLLALCLVAALLPVGAFAYSGSGTSESPWVIGDAKVYVVNGSELHIYADTVGKTFVEPAAADAPWKNLNINSVVVESNISVIDGRDSGGAFKSVRDNASLTFERNLDLGATGKIGFIGGTLASTRRICLVVKGTTPMTGGTGNQQWANLIPFIQQLEIRNGVTNIGGSAFYGASNITTVTIPESVLSVGGQAFGGTGLTAVELKHDFSGSKGLDIGDAAFPGDVKINLEITASDSSWNYSSKDDQPWKNYRANIANVKIDEAASNVAAYAFASCMNIKSMNLCFAGSTSSSKTIGENWMLGVDEKAIIGVSARANAGSVAFKEWSGEGIAFTDKYSANTFMDYKGETFTVTANWTTEIPGIKLEPQQNKNFGELEFGYEAVELYTVKVTNVGNTTISLAIETTGGNSSAFLLSVKNMTLAPNKSESFSVSPKAGQAIGRYHSTVALKDGDNVTRGSFDVKYNVGTSYTRASDFVERLYQYALNRKSDEAGLKDWATKISENQITAAEVAAGFFGSVEHRNRGLNDQEFVKALYLAMMNRPYDEGGLKTWTDQLAAGKSRSWVFAQFVNSAEFKNLCAYYGLTLGSIDYTKYDMGKNNKENTVSANIKAFVERMYTKCLNRAAEEAGLNDWSSRLAAGKETGASVAAGFFGSLEYRNRGRNDTEFLNDVYAVVFNRSVDASGAKTWGDAMASGKTRAWVLQQICASAEFNALCSSYGIKVGTFDPTKYDMGKTTSTNISTADAETFVKTLYKYILGRSDAAIAADAASVNGYVNNLVKNGKSGADIAVALYTSKEYQNRNLTSEQFIVSLYQALLGRTTVASSEYADLLNRVNTGKTTRAAALAEIVNSAEYKNRCSGLKLIPGSVDAKKIVIDPNNTSNVISDADAEAFVKKLYVAFLGREADEAGLKGWVNKIKVNKFTAAQVIVGILTDSGEYAARGLTDEQYVNALYQGLLNRTPDASEVSTHTTALANKSQTRGQVLAAFISGAEFKTRCAAIKLTPGSINGAKTTIK